MRLIALVTCAAMVTAGVAADVAPGTARSLRLIVRCSPPGHSEVITIENGHARVGQAGTDAATAERRGDHVPLVADAKTRRLVWRLPHDRIQQLRWPSSLAEFGNAVIDRRGRLIAVSFFDPPPALYLDVWTLDTKTARFSRLTGLIAEDAFKFTSMTWTRDGRLALLTRLNDRPLLRLWQPGLRRPASYVLPLCRAAGLFTLVAP